MTEIPKLSLLDRLQLKLTGYVCVGPKQKEGWKSPIVHYLFRCPVHGLVIDYPHGYDEKLVCPICSKEDEAANIREFPKNHRRTYRILDDEAYERFWWGRKPSTRRIFEEWLFEPKATMNAVSLKHGKTPPLLERLSGELRRQGIMDVVRQSE